VRKIKSEGRCPLRHQEANPRREEFELGLHALRYAAGTLFRKLAAIQDALIFVVQPPPVAGIGNAGGFRMMVEDRAGRGPRHCRPRRAP
jgi:hypothetical protein